MASKSILLAVTDPQTLIDINLALGAGWETMSVTSEAEALAQVETRSFDALLVDFNLGSPDASDLMNQTMEKRPEIMRFLLAYEADLALVAAKVDGSHQILPKPFEPASLKSRIENGVNDSNPEQTASDPAEDIADKPPTRCVYSDVLKALDSPDVTSWQVGEIIAGDAALTAELLSLTKSAYLGLPGNLTDPAEAVESLGLEAVKALVMAQRFLAEHSHLKPAYLSFQQIWQHSIYVAQIARDLVLFEKGDRTMASQALAAGLLHDLGKVVLVTNFDDLYGRVHSLARKQPIPLWDIEKEMFGANHGEIGGCLVGMWNMPPSIVEATAFHHEPPLGENEHLNPLAAVHIANVLAHQLRPNDECRVAPSINTTFLNELGLLQRLPVWRATFGNRGSADHTSPADMAEIDSPESVVTTMENTQTANLLPAPVSGIQTTTSGQSIQDPTPTVSVSRKGQKHWVYAGVVAGALLLLGLWFRIDLNFDDSAPIHARTPATDEARPVVSLTTPAETPLTPAPEVAPAPVVSNEPPATTVASTVTQPAIPEPAPKPAPAIPSLATVSNIPPPSLVAKESALPDFRVNGIIYTVNHPSAILNGERVNVGDQLGGATVISIRPTEVTLQFNGLTKTYTLR